jgi:predicted GH43/DUF377 family glycosyl hydrolase
MFSRPSLIACCISLLLQHCSNPPSKSPEGDNWTIKSFSKVDSVNPILAAGSGEFICPVRKTKLKWENKDVFNPAAIAVNDTVYLLYRAEDTIGKHAGTSRIGIAVSTDGLHFKRDQEPVLYPDNDEQNTFEWEGGCEDPRIVRDSSGRFIMTYTAYDGKLARLMVATSSDLRHWNKHGHVFQRAYDGKYVNKWSKSGAILASYESGSPVAVKINGLYWMYWGDVNIWAATSTDLVNWTPVLYENNEKPEIALRHYAKEIPEVKIVFGPRNGYFDSDLVEPGPAAMLTDKGIELIYNSRNVPSIGDTALTEGTYAVGQALMDAQNPTKIIARNPRYLMAPDKPYEITGQVNHVCFVEGLVRFNNRWFIYYGTADSKIAVATAN